MENHVSYYHWKQFTDKINQYIYNNIFIENKLSKIYI